MFKEVRIKSYRGLRNSALPDLQQINIIIGENNSGKTSLLEAIQLFDHKDILTNLISIARRREPQMLLGIRGRMQPFDMFLYQLDGIMLICDADQKTALQKRQKMLDSYQEKSDFKIIQEKDSVRLDVGIRVMPLYTFLFPDNNGRGNLENLLLETAEEAYPGLLGLAKDYVAGASEFQQKLRKDSCAKKAVVGCIANAMKPGKANQVSIADDEWISEKTLKTCRMLAALNNELQRMIK